MQLNGARSLLCVSRSMESPAFSYSAFTVLSLSLIQCSHYLRRILCSSSSVLGTEVYWLMKVPFLSSDWIEQA